MKHIHFWIPPHIVALYMEVKVDFWPVVTIILTPDDLCALMPLTPVNPTCCSSISCRYWKSIQSWVHEQPFEIHLASSHRIPVMSASNKVCNESFQLFRQMFAYICAVIADHCITYRPMHVYGRDLEGNKHRLQLCPSYIATYICTWYKFLMQMQ